MTATTTGAALRGGSGRHLGPIIEMHADGSGGVIRRAEFVAREPVARARAPVRATLAQYKRHAAKFGPAEVLEVARGDLSPRQLVSLLQYVEGLDPWLVLDGRGRLVEHPTWSRPIVGRAWRRSLALDLIDLGEADGFIAGALGMDRRTVAGLRDPGDVDRPKTAENAAWLSQVRVARKSPGTIPCPECNALFVQAPGRGRPRLYCSDECRRTAYSRRRREGVAR
jgi:hypothetical protein